MPGLSDELHKRCRTTLLKCDEFDRDISLRAVFVTPELQPFQNDLPQAASRSDRVDVTLDFLLRKHLADDRPLLLPFLSILPNN